MQVHVKWNSSRGRLAMFNFPQLRTTVLPTELRTTSLQLTFSPFFSHQTMPTNTNCVHVRDTDTAHVYSAIIYYEWQEYNFVKTICMTQVATRRCVLVRL